MATSGSGEGEDLILSWGLLRTASEDPNLYEAHAPSSSAVVRSGSGGGEDLILSWGLLRTASKDPNIYVRFAHAPSSSAVVTRKSGSGGGEDLILSWGLLRTASKTPIIHFSDAARSDQASTFGTPQYHVLRDDRRQSCCYSMRVETSGVICKARRGPEPTP